MAKFVFSTTPREYWWPVKVQQPNPDPKKSGQNLETAFKAQFRSMPTNEAFPLLREDPAELIKQVVIDWDEAVVDEEGQAISFDDDTLANMLTDAFVLKGFLQAWTESISGNPAKK